MANTFDGVNITKLNGNLNEGAGNEDNVNILIAVIPAADLPAGVVHNSVHELKQVQDAEDLGFTAAWDANESLWVHGTITEYFDYAPEAVLFLIPVADGALPSAILALDAVKASIRVAANKNAHGIAIWGTAETPVELAADSETVQTQINNLAAEHIRIDYVLLQGNDKVAPDDWDIADLVDMRTKNAPNVSICIGQDPYVAALDAAYAAQADIGSALGMLAARRVNENLGSIDIANKPRQYRGAGNYTLTRDKRWVDAQLSNGDKISAQTAVTLTAITDKGYIFAGRYAGYGGFYFNDAPTSVAATDDYNRIEKNRVFNKAARLVRRALLPYVKGVVKKDPTTGYIRSTTISNWKTVGEKALETMLVADEISGYAMSIDPKQLPSASSPVQVNIQVVMDGIAHSFDVNLGLANQIV